VSLNHQGRPMGQGASIEVSNAALPLSCPRPEDKLWNAHPRVFLPLEETGEAHCPYCNQHYIVKD